MKKLCFLVVLMLCSCATTFKNSCDYEKIKNGKDLNLYEISCYGNGFTSLNKTKLYAAGTCANLVDGHSYAYELDRQDIIRTSKVQTTTYEHLGSSYGTSNTNYYSSGYGYLGNSQSSNRTDHYGYVTKENEIKKPKTTMICLISDDELPYRYYDNSDYKTAIESSDKTKRNETIGWSIAIGLILIIGIASSE